MLDIATLILGILGTLLGVLSFYNQYLHRFRPKVHIFGNVSLRNFTDENRIVWTQETIVSIAVSNSRNAYGRIDDFILCLYSHSGTTSNPNYFYAAKFYEKDATTPFSPVVLQPRSSVTMRIGFEPEYSTHPGILFVDTSEASVRLYARMENKKRYREVTDIYLFPEETNRKSGSNGLVHLSQVNLAAARREGLKHVPPPETGSYRGASHKWLNQRLSRFWWTLRLPFRLIRALYKTALNSTFWLFHRLIWDPLTMEILQSEIPKHWRVKGGILEADDYTKDSLQLLQTDLAERIGKLNPVLKEDDQLKLKTSDSRIEVTRGKWSLSIQSQGDNRIIVIGSGNSKREIDLLFTYKKTIIGYRYWTIKGRYIPRRSIPVLILNYLTLYSASR